MDAFLTFILLFGLYLLVNTLYVLSKTGWSIKGFKEYWTYSEGNTSILLSYLKLFGAVVVIVFVSMLANNALAGEWFNGGSVFVGLETSNDRSVFCKSKGINNTTNSNMGIKQNVYDFSNGVKFNLKGTHHSCFANPDAVGYDKAGFELSVEY